MNIFKKEKMREETQLHSIKKCYNKFYKHNNVDKGVGNKIQFFIYLSSLCMFLN